MPFQGDIISRSPSIGQNALCWGDGALSGRIYIVWNRLCGIGLIDKHYCLKYPHPYGFSCIYHFKYGLQGHHSPSIGHLAQCWGIEELPSP